MEKSVKDINLDTYYTTFPICPYCGNVDRDAWEIQPEESEFDGTTECGNCGKEMKISRHCQITYCTEAIK